MAVSSVQWVPKPSKFQSGILTIVLHRLSYLFRLFINQCIFTECSIVIPGTFIKCLLMEQLHDFEKCLLGMSSCEPDASTAQI